MNSLYFCVPMRRGAFGSLTSCSEDTRVWDIAEWHVVARNTGRLAARCDTAVDARQCASALWAVETSATIAAESERCRLAACAALGTDTETLTAAIAAMIEGRTDLLQRLLMVRDAIDADNDEHSDGEGHIVAAAIIAVAGVAA